jgi:hypothetical protein
VGEARVRKYGERILTALHAAGVAAQPSDSGFALTQHDVEREYRVFVRAQRVSAST